MRCSKIRGWARRSRTASRGGDAAPRQAPGARQRSSRDRARPRPGAGSPRLAGRTAAPSGSAPPPAARGRSRLLLGACRPTFGVPVLVVQHISRVHRGLIRWLDDEIALPVRMAVEGVQPEPGVTGSRPRTRICCSSVAPAHSIALHLSARTGPPADVLLRSMASGGGQAAAVVLTGMGRDGALGVGAVAARVGPLWLRTRRARPCIGMPRAALERGAEVISSPQEIALGPGRSRGGELR